MFDRILKPVIVLLALVFLAALALSHLKGAANAQIQKKEAVQRENALKRLLAGFEISPPLKMKIRGREFEYWKGRKDEGKLTAFAFIGSAPGGPYGRVRTLACVDEYGRVLGIAILDPVFPDSAGRSGAKYFSAGSGMDAVRSPRWFEAQFTGLNLTKRILLVRLGECGPALGRRLGGRNAVSAVTGAEPASEAVADGISEGMDLLQEALALEQRQKKEAALNGKEGMK